MKLNTKKTILVGLAFMTISAFWQLYNNEVPLMLEELIGKNRQMLIGIIMSLDNVSAIFLLPLLGTLSDKTSTPLGKRMPYIIAGTVLSVFFMMIMPVAYNRASAGWFLFAVVGVLLSMSLYRSPAVALMPDVTPKPLRSKGNAVINLLGAVGIVFIQLLTLLLRGSKNYTKLFVILGIFMIASIAVMAVTVKENKWVAEMPPEEETDEEKTERENKGIKLKGSVKKSLVFLLISVFLWFMAYSAIETNYSRYANDVWQLSEGAYVKPMLFGSVMALISFLPLGSLSGKLGRKKTVLLGLGFLFSAVVVTSFVSDYSPIIYLLFAFIGISWAAINVNSYPMVVEMSKGADVGKYTGLYYTFSMAAQIVTPVLTGWLFDVLPIKYRILFPYAAFFLMLAFITTIFVRHGDVTKESIEALEEMAEEEKGQSL